MIKQESLWLLSVQLAGGVTGNHFLQILEESTAWSWNRCHYRLGKAICYSYLFTGRRWPFNISLLWEDWNNQGRYSYCTYLDAVARRLSTSAETSLLLRVFPSSHSRGSTSTSQKELFNMVLSVCNLARIIFRNVSIQLKVCFQHLKLLTTFHPKKSMTFSQMQVQSIH